MWSKFSKSIKNKSKCKKADKQRVKILTSCKGDKIQFKKWVLKYNQHLISHPLEKSNSQKYKKR
jgi:hypothetical protein